MAKCEHLVHLRLHQASHREFAAEPPRQFADQHVANDHAATASFEVMFMAKARKRTVSQFLCKLIRRIEDASEELEYDRKESVDSLHEPRDTWLHLMSQQPEARHPLVQHCQVGGVLVEVKEIFQVRVDAALIDELHRTPSKERRTSEVRSNEGFHAAIRRLAAATIRLGLLVLHIAAVAKPRAMAAISSAVRFGWKYMRPRVSFFRSASAFCTSTGISSPT